MQDLGLSAFGQLIGANRFCAERKSFHQGNRLEEAPSSLQLDVDASHTMPIHSESPPALFYPSFRLNIESALYVPAMKRLANGLRTVKVNLSLIGARVGSG